jgi:chloramphenicol 3-O phosphotransferase
MKGVVVTQVIVLNGGSSAGKSTIARALQEMLPGLWLTFGADVLIEALPGRGEDPRSGLVLEPDGTVTVRPDRIPGMAAKQAAAVPAGVVYDVEVDTTEHPAAACARRIAGHVSVNSTAAGGFTRGRGFR